MSGTRKPRLGRAYKDLQPKCCRESRVSNFIIRLNREAALQCDEECLTRETAENNAKSLGISRLQPY